MHTTRPARNSRRRADRIDAIYYWNGWVPVGEPPSLAALGAPFVTVRTVTVRQGGNDALKKAYKSVNFPQVTDSPRKNSFRHDFRTRAPYAP